MSHVLKHAFREYTKSLKFKNKRILNLFQDEKLGLCIQVNIL